MNGKNKGSSFERFLCKKLSLWWTGGERSDIFWRTSNSGGRATFSNRKGEGTKRHCGDLCAIDPLGEPFLERVTVEIKKGYNRATLHDLLDKPGTAAQQMYEQWFEQAEESRKNSGSDYWMVIHARDRRQTLALFPYGLLNGLFLPPFPASIILFWNRMKICCCRLEDFLSSASPEDFRFRNG